MLFEPDITLRSCGEPPPKSDIKCRRMFTEVEVILLNSSGRMSQGKLGDFPGYW
jgi:hypothetical protein